MKQRVKIILSAILYFILGLCSQLCFADPSISFGGLDLNPSDELLFTESQEYKSLYSVKLAKNGISSKPKSLTCYPEKINSLGFSDSLLIRNKNGIALYSESEGKLNWVSYDSDFRSIKISPDGKWACYISSEFPSSGQLVLLDVVSGKKSVLADRLSVDSYNVNVKWAPDSSFVIYEKGDSLYFVNPEIACKNIDLEEEFRKIGKGTIQSVEWTQNKSLLFISGDIIYKINESELFIRGLYSSFVGEGSVVGRLLYAFDSVKDKFWCNADGSQIVINTENKFVTYCTINEEKYDFVQPVVQQPLSIVPGAPLECQVFWQIDSSPVLWIDYIRYSNEQKASSVYSLSDKVHLISTVDSSISPVVSPDGKHVAFSDKKNMLVYSLDGWKEVAVFSGQEIVNVEWKSSNSLYVGGKETVNYVQFLERDYAVSKKEKVLFLSSVYKAYWNGNDAIAYTSSNSCAYSFNPDNNLWSIKKDTQKENKSQGNDNFRVFISEAENSEYANAVYIRTLDDKAFTYPLEGKTQHVSKKLKKVALVFDAVGDAQSFGRILYTLKKHNACGTFFINGEFIQRYPLETKLLANSGNLCASMFYYNVDLLNSNYKIDKDFIRQGLARNEDEFHLATGKELALLWHAPFNRYNDYIKQAGTESGYHYVDYNDIQEDKLIIPMSVVSADRELETVIVSLINDGYKFVSVLDFMEDQKD